MTRLPANPQVSAARRAAAMARMSWLPVIWWIVSTVCLFTAGCGSPCGDGSCPTATYKLPVLDDSAVTWSFAGSPPQTIGVVPYPSTSSDCVFETSVGIINPVGDAGATSVIGTFYLQCVTGGAARFNMVLSDLGDFRDWPAGTFTLFAHSRNFGIDYHAQMTVPPGPAGRECSVATLLDGMAITVTVGTATGGAAPYPQLVTDDFVRDFRLDFDTTGVEATNSSHVPCDFSLAAQVSLHFRLTAADYVYDPNAPCGCD